MSLCFFFLCVCVSSPFQYISVTLLLLLVGLLCVPTCGTDGITGLSLKSFKDNWGSAYQTTNNAGIPDPFGKIYWDFK